MFRKRKTTVLDRLPTDEIARGAAALRDRASDAAGALAPKVEAAREALAPRVDQVRGVVQPRMEAAWGAIAPTVGAVATSALEAAKQRAEDTAKSTAPTRKEARRRASNAAAALRGEKPPRRWFSLIAALGLGAAVGAVAGVLSRRMTAPLAPPPVYTPPPSPAPRPPATASEPVTRNEETVVDLTTEPPSHSSTSQTAPDPSTADQPKAGGGATSRPATKPAKAGTRPPAPKKDPTEQG